ncbi:hypothetical protein JKP88DRAFT_274562 [Tribonema minus]|uniref:Uncharacterized protein n=1 Tax=Tribonema minus TaxID=303371 RepID=A0A836C7M3_9STRA|nr:hypothetical protein JKP88DRAFT_274562 [Tribonema minus]
MADAIAHSTWRASSQAARQSSREDRRHLAAEVVRAVDMLQGRHLLLQLDHSMGAPSGGAGGLCVVLRIEAEEKEAEEKEGLLHRLVELVKRMCADGGGSASVDQYGLRGHAGGAIIELVREFPAATAVK